MEKRKAQDSKAVFGAKAMRELINKDNSEAGFYVHDEDERPVDIARHNFTSVDSVIHNLVREVVDEHLSKTDAFLGSKEVEPFLLVAPNAASNFKKLYETIFDDIILNIVCNAFARITPGSIANQSNNSAMISELMKKFVVRGVGDIKRVLSGTKISGHTTIYTERIDCLTSSSNVVATVPLYSLAPADLSPVNFEKSGMFDLVDLFGMDPNVEKYKKASARVLVPRGDETGRFSIINPISNMEWKTNYEREIKYDRFSIDWKFDINVH